MRVHGVEVEFERATAGHGAELVANMRRECVADVEALGSTPREAVMRGLALSEAWAVLFSGRVAAIFGVSGTAGFWVLTTPEVVRHPRAFLKASRAAAQLLLEDRERLENFVPAAFAESVRWLEWLGAEVGEPVPRGPYGKPYCSVVLRREALRVRT